MKPNLHLTCAGIVKRLIATGVQLPTEIESHDWENDAPGLEQIAALEVFLENYYVIELREL